jgi:uncharacterized protein
MAQFRNAPFAGVFRPGKAPPRAAPDRAPRVSRNRARLLFPCRIIVLKLHQESSGALNTITSYGEGFVAVNLQRHEGSVIIVPDAPVQDWPVTAFDALTPADFDALIEAAPEVVIFGSGAKLRFPHPRLVANLAKHHIGVETMDFGAACRTYNILMSEGRRVAAALLIEG